MQLDMGIVRTTLAAIIEGGMPDINAYLRRVREGRDVRSVLRYYTENLDEGMLPCIMLQQASEAPDWEGMEAIATDAFAINIYGLVHFDRDEFTDDIVAALASGVRDVVNRRHESRPAGDGKHKIYFQERTPINSIFYGDLPFVHRGTLVAGFLATWKATVCYQLIDPSI